MKASFVALAGFLAVSASARAEIAISAHDPMAAVITQEDAARMNDVFRKALLPMGPNGTSVAASILECGEGLDFGPAACSLGFGIQVQGDDYRALAPIIFQSEKLVYRNPGNHLRRDMGDMIQVKKAECRQDQAIECVIEFKMPAGAAS